MDGVRKGDGARGVRGRGPGRATRGWALSPRGRLRNGFFLGGGEGDRARERGRAGDEGADGRRTMMPIVGGRGFFRSRSMRSVGARPATDDL